MTIGLYPIWRYWGYAKLYDSRDHDFDFELNIFYGTEICLYMTYRRHGSTEYNTGHISEMRNWTVTCPSLKAKYDLESDPESQLQCRYRTSWTRLFFSGTTIVKERDDSAGIATTSTANNYRTGSAGTKHHEMHSPIDKATSGEKCPQGSDGKRTYRGINTPHAQVTNPEWDRGLLSAIPTQSQQSRHTRLLWISCQRSYDVPKGHDCTGIKTNPYCKQSPYRKYWEEAPWSALTGRESQLDIGQWAYVGRGN